MVGVGGEGEGRGRGGGRGGRGDRGRTVEEDAVAFEGEGGCDVFPYDGRDGESVYEYDLHTCNSDMLKFLYGVG